MKQMLMNETLGVSLFIKVFSCICIVAITLIFYMTQQNKVTELRIILPVLEKRVNEIQEENMRLRYQIEQFESPIHLMELARKAEYGHLKYPYLDEVVVIPVKESK